MKIEIEREEDGRWIAEVPELPGVLVYGTTEAEVRNRAGVLSLRVIADRLEAGRAGAVRPGRLLCRSRVGGPPRRLAVYRAHYCETGG